MLLSLNAQWVKPDSVVRYVRFSIAFRNLKHKTIEVAGSHVDGWNNTKHRFIHFIFFFRVLNRVHLQRIKKRIFYTKVHVCKTCTIKQLLWEWILSKNCFHWKITFFFVIKILVPFFCNKMLRKIENVYE